MMRASIMLAARPSEIDLDALKRSESEALLGSLIAQRARLQLISEMCFEAKELGAAIACERAITSSLETTSKLLGMLVTSTTATNVLISSDYFRLRSTIVAALRKHPEAARDVARALADLELEAANEIIEASNPCNWRPCPMPTSKKPRKPAKRSAGVFVDLATAKPTAALLEPRRCSRFTLGDGRPPRFYYSRALDGPLTPRLPRFSTPAHRSPTSGNPTRRSASCGNRWRKLSPSAACCAYRLASTTSSRPAGCGSSCCGRRSAIRPISCSTIPASAPPLVT
jgi:hypothetical protein